MDGIAVADLVNKSKSYTDPRIVDLKEQLGSNPKLDILKKCPTGLEVRHILEFAEHVYCLIAGTKPPEKTRTHNVPLELFRAPVPFPLQELITAINEIRTRIKTCNRKQTIRLLLIDNKIDKVIKRDSSGRCSHGGLITLLLDGEYSSCFELEMLGRLKHTKEQPVPIPTYEEYERLKREETFDFTRFKRSLDALGGSEPVDDKENNYAWKVYTKVKAAHFVLLDFFLDDANMYLAFDFINDLCRMKRRQRKTFTTWFFITSAVHDSVVKYSQSGLLAEYYESAVVSAGDDPTNKKRQIIFLYKLLTFINSRFANFKRYKDSIHEKLFADWDNKEACNDSQPCYKIYKNKKCGEEDCMQGLQSDIKRYLTEYDDVCSIFYDRKDSEDLKDIVELLDNVIKQFVWLPEADWYMIQHQIDFINSKLGGLKDRGLKKCKFSCKYILKELADRSEVY